MKNIKFLKKVGLIIMAAALITMSACSKINKDTANEVCSYLEGQYGCKFVASQIGDRLNKSTAKLYVYPESNSEIVFTAVIDTNGNIREDYVAHLVLYTIETSIHDAFNSNGMKCSVNAVITEDDIHEENPNITVQEFVDKNNIDSIFVRIVIDEATLDASGIVKALEDASKNCGVTLAVSAYILSSDSYQQCKSDFVTYPSVGATQIESYNPVSTFSTVVTNGVSSLTTDQLADALEGR